MSTARRRATYQDVVEGGALVRAEPFEALELDMRRWWGEA